MLAPMCLANPHRAWWFALLTTLTSVAGGLFGYLIGYYAFDLIEPWLRGSNYWGAYEQAVAWFDAWGFWAIFIAGFSPIPYKVFTIAAGVASMALLPFTLASLVGRGARFFLVAGLMAWGGERMEGALRKYVDRIGWATVAAVVVGVLVYRGKGGGGGAPRRPDSRAAAAPTRRWKREVLGAPPEVARLLSAHEEAVELGQAELRPGGAAVVALVGALGGLHVAQQGVHLG